MTSSSPTPDEATAERLIESAQASEREGRRDDARAGYERALRAIRDPSQTGLLAQLVRWIGRTHYADGDIDAAMDCCELSLGIAEANQDLAGIAHALNFAGTIRQHRGELDDALALYRKARSYGSAAEDANLVALIDVNLGIIANIRGDYSGALEHYHESLSGFRLVGAEEHVAHVLNNLGLLYTDQERWLEAERCYGEALESCVRSGSASIQLMVEVNRAELWIAQREFEKAQAACDAASALAARLGDDRATGELEKHRGVIHRERGDHHSADECLSRAEHFARDREDRLLAGEVARERAELYRRQRRYQETLRELNQAHRSFELLRAERDVADVARQMAALETQFLDIVRGWGESIESVDHYTQGHCQRVADFGCILARAAGMDEQTLFWFRLGALLHDVGKIVVSPEILNKPGPLTAEERAVIERHPDAGVQLLAEVEFPWDVRPMVRHHHERWGGGGYPDGLVGEEIPWSARILCIADVYDALTSGRPYREGHSHERALEIMRGMVSHFDPVLLALWEELCRSGVIRKPDLGPDRPRPPHDAHSAESLSRSGRAGDPARLRVLVIGSAPPASGSLLGEAEAAGLDLSFSAGIPEALEQWSTDPFGAVLLHLADQHDAELGRLARVREWLPDTPIVLLSAHDDPTLALRAMREGAQDFLVAAETTPGLLRRSLRFAIERNRVRLEERARSLTDDLTGLYNRRGFFTVCRQQWLITTRRRAGMVLFFIDLDELKQINDRFGHTEGDAALIDAGELLRATFRRSDILARIGGDEFAVLAADASEAFGEQMLARLEEQLRRHNASTGRPYPLSLSLGMAVARPGSADSVEDLVSRADADMYDRKRSRPSLRPVA